MAGVELPVQGWRDELLYLQRPPDLAGTHPAVVDDINGQYFRPETGQLMVVGPWGLGEEEEIGMDPDNYREWVDDRFILGMSQRLVRRIPAVMD